jgi:hypothetical protein
MPPKTNLKFANSSFRTQISIVNVNCNKNTPIKYKKAAAAKLNTETRSKIGVQRLFII